MPRSAHPPSDHSGRLQTPAAIPCQRATTPRNPPGAPPFKRPQTPALKAAASPSGGAPLHSLNATPKTKCEIACLSLAVPPDPRLSCYQQEETLKRSDGPRIRLIAHHGPLTRPLDLLPLVVQLGTGRARRRNTHATKTVIAARLVSRSRPLLWWLATCNIAAVAF